MLVGKYLFVIVVNIHVIFYVHNYISYSTANSPFHTRDY